MKCIEVIQLRASGASERRQAMSVCRQILQSNTGEQPNYIRLLKNASLGTDLCVCIRWDKPVPWERESRLGLQIQKGLSGFGIINHSLWMDEDFLPSRSSESKDRRDMLFDIQWLGRTGSDGNQPKEKINYGR